MRIKKIVMGTVVAGGVGLASLGAGAGVAAAAPHAPAQSTTQQYVQSAPVTPVSQPGPVRRPDNKPFTYRGQHVTPVFDQSHHAWGFWFFGFWIPIAH
ncbi:hypothetical protein [Williamsia maris]|uniref:Uncharacterized protein n=1 Tax=Williamsia maris TaxID=72806 RepID=A0ABT1HH61_9NOCA|nr:hypothetical protein [Williamsia maris]MCP2177583.1 hypothetical protein [Williamsia maris]